MESPVKKINFEPANKENMPLDNDAPVVEEVQVTKPEIKEAPKVAPTLRPEEADEPLLQENPNRFVLFPIKYHEVSRVDALRVKCFLTAL